MPTETLLQAVEEHLNKKTIRPLTDMVSVKAPTQVTYSIDVTIFISNEDRSQAAQIKDKTATRLCKIILSGKASGSVTLPSKLTYLTVNARAKRIEIREPSFIIVDETAVAICSNTAISFAYEDS